MPGQGIDFNETLKWAKEEKEPNLEVLEKSSSGHTYKALAIALVLIIGLLLIFWIFSTGNDSNFRLGEAILLASSPEYSIIPSD